MSSLLKTVSSSWMQTLVQNAYNPEEVGVVVAVEAREEEQFFLRVQFKDEPQPRCIALQAPADVADVEFLVPGNVRGRYRRATLVH